MRIILVVVIVVIVFVSGFFIYSYFRDYNLEDAIVLYENMKYYDSLKILKKLSKVLDYEKAEKVYYYRCKAINRLADVIEEDYDDEIKEILQDNSKKISENEEYKDLQKKIQEINVDLGSDLKIVQEKNNLRIISMGKFYDEFLAKYKGSNYIEDLDYEELEKIEKTENKKLLMAVSNFYGKYPNTMYISQLVKMLFRNLKSGAMETKGKEDFLKNLILSFAQRYPTSSEFYRIFYCNGQDVNMRNSSGIDGTIVGKIDNSEILIQLEKSMDTFQIGDIRDYWYRVASLKGKVGWIFGKFLSPIDLSKLKKTEVEENWSLEEFFTDWHDSNTPNNWMHISDSEKSSISFDREGEKKIIKLNSSKGKTSGLYRRTPATKKITLLTKARFLQGDSLIIIAYVMHHKKTFYLKLMDEEIEISGRKIPIHTSDWQEYVIASDDGEYAKLLVNGEIISSRIKPVSGVFTNPGIYCLYSPKDNNSSAEMEYLKVKY